MKADIKRLNIRLTEQEHAALASDARACGLTITDYVKARCLEDDGRPRIVTDVDALRQIYSSLKRIGGLLNQLMRHANSRRQDFPLLADDAAKTLLLVKKASMDVSGFISETKSQI